MRYLPFAEVVAIAFAGPMFMTLFGRFFLSESVGLHRLGAVLIGFVGVLFVIRPGTDAMHWTVVLPLIVALADASRDLVTRQMAVGESNLRIVFSTGRILAVTGLVTAVGGWQALRYEDLLWFGVSASAFAIAHYLMVEAFRHGQLVAVGPFRYIQILWTILALGPLPFRSLNDAKLKGNVPNNTQSSSLNETNVQCRPDKRPKAA
ncbi:MAG: drug/metabolite transporter (DMT)-like permease [Polaribacter sp.]